MNQKKQQRIRKNLIALIRPSKGLRKVKFGKGVTILEQRAAALEYRKMGYSFMEIGEALGISNIAASAHVSAALLDIRDRTDLDTVSIRDMELQRLDLTMIGLWPKIRKGDVGSILAFLKISERRSKLLGLDAPVKAQLSGAINMITPEEVARLTDSEIVAKVQDLMSKVKLLPETIDAEVVGTDEH